MSYANPYWNPYTAATSYYNWTTGGGYPSYNTGGTSPYQAEWEAYYNQLFGGGQQPSNTSSNSTSTNMEEIERLVQEIEELRAQLDARESGSSSNRESSSNNRSSSSNGTWDALEYAGLLRDAFGGDIKRSQLEAVYTQAVDDQEDELVEALRLLDPLDKTNFDLMDRNNDGVLSAAEITIFASRAGEYNLIEAADFIQAEVDNTQKEESQGSDAISFAAEVLFGKGENKVESVSREEIDKMLNEELINGDDSSRSKMKTEILQYFSKDVYIEELQTTVNGFTLADTNLDGKLDQSELVALAAASGDAKSITKEDTIQAFATAEWGVSTSELDKIFEASLRRMGKKDRGLFRKDKAYYDLWKDNDYELKQSDFQAYYDTLEKGSREEIISRQILDNWDTVVKGGNNDRLSVNDYKALKEVLTAESNQKYRFAFQHIADVDEHYAKGFGK